MTALGAWTGPALVVGVAALVFAGSPAAPAVALAVVVGPLLGILRRPDADTPPSALVSGVQVAAAGGALAATLLVMGEVERGLGLARWAGLASLLAVAGALALVPRLRPLRAIVLPAGIVLVAAPLGAAAVVTGVSPWGAWARLVEQPAVRFAARGAWASEGRTVARRSTLAFDEEQRITAVADGVFRVAERDGGRGVVREWRLRPGESINVRAGDEMTVPAGARIRFEPGRRVPGTPASGIAWAEPRARLTARAALESAGAIVTVAGGAAALVAAPGAGRLGALATGAMLVLLGSAATAWGVYAAWLAPDLALGASPLAALLETPVLAAGLGRGGAARWLLVTGLGLLAVAQAVCLHHRLAVMWSSRERGAETPSRSPDAAWLVVAGAATALALAPLDAWRILLAALGLAVSGALAPLLGGGARGAPAGAVAGALALAVLEAAPLALPAPASPALGLPPAVVAAPLGWLVARVVVRARGVAPVPRRRRAAPSCRDEATLPQ